jgi:hypothetical protein
LPGPNLSLIKIKFVRKFYQSDWRFVSPDRVGVHSKISKQLFILHKIIARQCQGHSPHFVVNMLQFRQPQNKQIMENAMDNIKVRAYPLLLLILLLVMVMCAISVNLQ